MVLLTAIAMTATLAVQGFLLFTVASYAAGGGDPTGLDIMLSGVAFFCVVGATVVLIGVLRGRQYVALAVTVATIGLAVPAVIAGLFALSGGLPFVY